MLKFLWSVNEQNCGNRTFEELNLKGDISWGAEKQFENEALMAVRTANFISAFLQVVDPKEVFPGTRYLVKILIDLMKNFVKFLSGSKKITFSHVSNPKYKGKV